MFDASRALAIPNGIVLGVTAAPVVKSSPLIDPVGYMRQGARQHEQGRKPSRVLREWALTNEWVRIAINRRKRQISQAKWRIVRTDDPKKPPNPRVVDAVNALLHKPNDKMESWRSVLDQVLEDLLTLDAGCIEKVRSLGRSGKGDGPIAELYAVDGATIFPDPAWDGSQLNAYRYSQVIDDKVKAQWRNQDMIYMMATPRTYSNRGWSPVETAVRSIEADLFGDDFDFSMLKQTQPSGMLWFANMEPADVAAYRSYWRNEIEGQSRIAIGGGFSPTGDTDAKWLDMRLRPDDLGREKYRTWTATKIAAAFELDLGVFNLTANLHKDTGAHQQNLTDEGHRTLGTLVAEYLTRELVSEFADDHALEIEGLNARDESAQAELDAKYIALGVYTPNMIGAEMGLDPVPWGDAPYIPGKGPWSGGSALGTKPDDESAPNPSDTLDDNTEDGKANKPDGTDGPVAPSASAPAATAPDPKNGGGAKALNPFGSRRPMHRTRPTT